MEWRSRAACLEAPDPNIFFPIKGKPKVGGVNPRDYCRRCEVSKPCLEYALTLPVRDYGIYADTNTRERSAIRRQARSMFTKAS